MFSYNKGRNTKKTIVKEHLGEIKSLAKYQVVKYAVHTFTFGTGTTLTFNQ